MRTHRFYKEQDIWFIDLKWFPKWWKAHLAMVAGADILLNILSEGAEEVTLKYSSKCFDRDAEKLERKMILPSWFMGAVYKSRERKFSNETVADNHLWLCWVTLLVFGRYPKEIYYKKV